MTYSSKTSSTELEEALASYEDSLDNRRKILQTLMGSRVFVVLDRPWDGRSLPSTEMRMLFVSDGENKEQPMLALFTAKDKSAAVPTEGSPFQHPVEVDAAWAFLGVPKEAGVLVNPNSMPGFRILPALAAELRHIAQKYLAAKIQKVEAAASGTTEP